MRKIILGMLVLAGATTYAQVGINKEKPQATLDINVQEDNKSNDHLEGLLIPRVSKQKALLMGGNAELQESTLIYVNDLSFTDPSDGTEAKVADITGNGYYFWNGTKWVKQTGQDGEEWVYDPVTKQINLSRSLQDDFKNKVYYDDKGNYRNQPKDIETIQYFSGGTWKEFPFGSNSAISFIAKSSKDMEYSPFNEKILSLGNLLLNEDSPTPDNGAYVSLNRKVMSLKGNTQNYNALNGAYLASVHNGEGVVNSLKGSYSAALQYSGTVKSLIGSQVKAQLSTGETDYLYGSTISTSMEEGLISVSEARGFSATNNIKGSTTVEYLAALEVSNSFWSNSSPTVTDMVGLRYIAKIDKKRNAAPTITNNYGLWMDDIEGGTDKNFAIYTKAGDIRFGDLADDTVTEDRLVVANTDGVLSTSATSLSDLESLWANDDSNTRVYLKNTSAGAPRTDSGDDRNSVAFDNEGFLIAKGFKGYNGSTIFPDYVFEKYYNGYSDIKTDYNFHNLASIESFVKKNGHLPGYKSAKEVAKEGLIDFGATQLTNIEKIEELYLHTIEQEKAIKAKDAKIAELEARLDRLEELINK